MTHLLGDENSRNGHAAVPLQALHTHRNFTTTLRLPREHVKPPPSPRPPRHPQAVPAARYRRARTWRELAFDLVLGYVLPASVLLFVFFCVIAFFWLGQAIDRAIRSLNGGL